MKNIVLINGQGFGREVAEWISLMPGYGSEFVLKGFLDTREPNSQFLGLPVLGSPAEYTPMDSDYFVIALSDPHEKAKMVKQLQKHNCRFFTVIHPQNFVSATAKIGIGCILAPFNSVSSEAEIGDFVTLYGFNRVGHNAKIQRFSHLASHISVGGNAVVPENCRLPDFISLAKNAVYESE